jgi:hypothetical protein
MSRMLETGDANKDGSLDKNELRKMFESFRDRGGRPGESGRPGPGGKASGDRPQRPDRPERAGKKKVDA